MKGEYIGYTFIAAETPLRRELAKLRGIGHKNVHHILKCIRVPLKESDKITVDDLSQDQKKILESLLYRGYVEAPRYHANRKYQLMSQEEKSLVFYEPTDQIFIGDNFTAQSQLARKRLIKLKCNTGNRLKVGRKVHGQKTKTTGRKNKILKGFQKKKK